MSKSPAATRALPRQKPARRMPDYEGRKKKGKKELPVNGLIKVTVEPYFLPLYSAPNDGLFTFGYKVSFKNTGATPVWLHTRNWLITKGKNQFDVFGPTVGGQESFELPPRRKKPIVYKSVVPLDAKTGYKMKGYFKGSTTPDGTGKAFVTEEKEFSLNVPDDDWRRKCQRNHANAEFADYVDDDDLESLRKLLRDYDKTGELNTRNLRLKDRGALREFERLLLKQFLTGFGERSISLRDIHPSFPARLNIWDMACLALDETYSIQILKHQGEQKPGAEPRAGYGVILLFPVAKSKPGGHNQPDMPTSPNIGDALKEKLDHFEDEFGVEAAKEEYARRTSPARVGVLNPDMAARGLMKEASAEITGPPLSPFGESLRGKNEQERREALLQHYGVFDDKQKKYVIPKWADNRGHKPTPEKFIAFLNAVYSTRVADGLRLSDMADLDHEAFATAKGFRTKRANVRQKLIDQFGLLLKNTKYDPEQDGISETAFKELKRKFERGRYHEPRL